MIFQVLSLYNDILVRDYNGSNLYSLGICLAAYLHAFNMFRDFDFSLKSLSFDFIKIKVKTP